MLAKNICILIQGQKKKSRMKTNITKYTHALRIYCYNHFEDKDNLYVNSNTGNL